MYFLASKATVEDAALTGHPEYILIEETLSNEERKQAVISICTARQIDIIINKGGEFENFPIFSNQVLTGV